MRRTAEMRPSLSESDLNQMLKLSQALGGWVHRLAPKVAGRLSALFLVTYMSNNPNFCICGAEFPDST